MKNNAIVSLAILKVNYDEKKDYLDTFLPFVAECIKIEKDDIISITNIQQSVKNEFSLDIPQHAIKALLNKAYKAKYLKKENKVFTRNDIGLKKLNFNSVKNEMLRKQNDLITDLIKYVKEKFDKAWKKDEAEEYLLKFIENNQIMSFKKNIIFTESIENSDDSSEKLYIARYIKTLIDNESHLFGYLEDIIKGLIISTVVYMNEPSEIKKSFRNMTVYLDTSFIIFSLGYAGEIKQQQCDELLKLIYENNINARCFRHTIDEVIGILTACAHKIDSKNRTKAYGPSIDYFIEEGKSKSDIMLMINTIEDDLSRLNIKIEDVPQYNNRCYIDEEGLKESLKKNIQYSNDEALERDIKSISAITRLRSGRTTIKIEESRAIFVTTNFKLVKEVNSYLNIDEELTGIMPIISDYALTNLLWLKKPLVAKNLSKQRLIAECYAASQPDEILWGKYINEIDNLKNKGHISEEESCYFKYAPAIKEICMDITEGKSEVVCEGTVKQIMDRARELISKETEERLNSEMKKVEMEKEISDKKVLDKENKIKEQNKNIITFAKKKAKRRECAVKWGLLSLEAITFLLGENFISNIIEEKYPSWARLTSIIALIIGTIAFFYTAKGENIKSFSNKIGKKKYYKILAEMNIIIPEVAVDCEEN
ncbi:TPA: hypothetical protein ACOTGN_001388 [Clostridium perfringens]|uniref:hypothetical protein n=1 Tax=Clostridium perfringens TaxID=1502 RepID=UPI002A38A4C2|nr:hypothetical protein [Clostridium perfringens]